MKRLLFVVFASLLMVPSVYAQHGPHQDLVAKAQTDLRAAGIDITGDCGAFKVTNLAVVYIRAAGDSQAGLLAKTAGSGCSAYGGALYAKDAIVYPNGEVYDTIIASGAMGGNGGPTWNPAGARSDVVCPCPPGLWRAPVDPALYGYGAPQPTPTPQPVPQPTPGPAPIVITPSVDLSGVNVKLDSLYQQAERIFAAQEAEVAARNAQLDLLNAKVQQHIDETHSFIDKVGGFFTDGKTITAIVAGAVTYLGTHAATK